MQVENFFLPDSAAVKTELGLESQSPPSLRFLSVFSKTYGQTKIDVLARHLAR